MRVLFLVTCYPCKNAPVDAIFHRTVCEALMRRGVEVEVLAPVPRVPYGLKHISKKLPNPPRRAWFFLDTNDHGKKQSLFCRGGGVS